MKNRLIVLNQFIAENDLDLDLFYVASIYQLSQISLQGEYCKQLAELGIKYARPVTDKNDNTRFEFDYNNVSIHIVLT
jgi:hypothetical protein